MYPPKKTPVNVLPFKVLFLSVPFLSRLKLHLYPKYEARMTQVTLMTTTRILYMCPICQNVHENLQNSESFLFQLGVLSSVNRWTAIKHLSCCSRKFAQHLLLMLLRTEIFSGNMKNGQTRETRKLPTFYMFIFYIATPFLNL